MRVRTPVLTLLSMAGLASFVGCVVEAEPLPSGRPNPNAGGSVSSGGMNPGVGGTGTAGTFVGTGGSDPGIGGTDPGTGGTDPGAGGTDPGSGGTDPGTGGSDPGTGGSGAVQCGVPSPDANCTSSLAKTNATCTVDCCIACGFNALGTKTCTCDGTVYTACPCAKPSNWMGAATAEACTSVIGNDGLVDTNDETPCTTEWTQCIAADAPSGSTPKGCVCLPDPEAGGALQWSCGSTNKWFICPAGASHPGCPPPA